MSFFHNKRSALPRKAFLLPAAAAAALLCILLRRPLMLLLSQILLAALLAWAARPLCAVFEKRLPSALSALLSLGSFLLAIVLLLWLLVPQLLRQSAQALSSLPQLTASLRALFDRVAASPLGRHLGFSFDSLQDLPGRIGSSLLGVVPQAIQKIAATGTSLVRIFLSIVLAFYFLRDRDFFCFQLSLLIPLRHRRRTLSALRDMRCDVALYFRGQMLVSLSVALLTAAALLILRVPAWLLLGILMGICDLIPYAGPYLGGAVILLFSLPLGASTLLWTIAAIIVIQQIESIFLSPLLMSTATGLHPACVLMLLSAGGMVGGLLGMLVTLPLFVCVRGAVRAFRSAAYGDNN